MSEQEQALYKLLGAQFPRAKVGDIQFAVRMLISQRGLSTVLRAAGDDAVAEALREVGWTVDREQGADKNDDGEWVPVVCYEAMSEWRPVTEGDEHGE